MVKLNWQLLQNQLYVKPCMVEIEFQFQITFNLNKFSILSFRNKVFDVSYVGVIIYFGITMSSVHIGVIFGVTILEFVILLFPSGRRVHGSKI